MSLRSNLGWIPISPEHTMVRKKQSGSTAEQSVIGHERLPEGIKRYPIPESEPTPVMIHVLSFSLWLRGALFKWDCIWAIRVTVRW